ncbi:hypothetical protein AC481_05935 [miscellaneous Crenarchaeota group archaeon SMTZ-80]|nr:MAG: hypothetical protein AC481_05935 [miscellaneous Crenarchaeota group archaeon SMTZ-80]
MMTNKNEGICRFCMNTFSGTSMGRHLVSCEAKKQEDSRYATNKKIKSSIYHIKVSAYKAFWLHIEMNATATLDELDQFLRDIWLECCGHLSEFTINGIRYEHSPSNDGWGMKSKSMNIQLRKALNVKDKFSYEYDFGSTTYLEGQVFAEREGLLKEKVRILARNNPYIFKCESCDAKATEICMECQQFFCDQCLIEHGCSEEMALPVINSPRMGVCGYCGTSDFDNFTMS